MMPPCPTSIRLLERWQSASRDHAHDRFPVVTKAHPLIQLVCAAVVAHDMQERDFVALHLASNQLEHQPARKPSALEVRVRTDTTDFAQRTGSHTLARHRYKALSFEAAKVLAQLDSPRTERPWTGQSGQLERL